MGWYDALIPLALAYQVTGNATYSTQVKNIMYAMANAGAAPCQVDSGFPSRSAMVAFAIGYDWIYPTLSASDKAAFTAEVDACWNWVQASGYQWNAASGEGPNGYGNYFAGHLEGYGLAALAVEGDDNNAAAMQATILTSFNKYVVPAFTFPTGGFSGGYAVEGYNYGGSNFLRLFSYMWAMKTAGKTDLLDNNIGWLKVVARNTVYEIRPNLWKISNDGDWSGSYVGILYWNFIYDMAGFLNGTTEGGWLQYLYNNLAMASDGVPASLYVPSAWEMLLFNTGQSGVNYTSAVPTYYYSPGDQHTITRTDWTTSAVQTMFNGGMDIFSPGDHQSRSAGHVDITRGSDPLVIMAGQWAGADGVAGAPQSFDKANWHQNTLYYWDGGTNCLSQTSSGGQYGGCQMFWSAPNTLTHREGTGFVFQEADLRPAYLNNNGLTTVANYHRSFVNIQGIIFVFDRISSPATSTRYLEWHTPALSSARPAGIATATSVNGGLATATVGSSKIWIGTLIPVAPTVNQVTDVLTFDVATPAATQRFEVSDPNGGNCSTNCLFLTVLAPTAAGAAQPTMLLITAPGYYGALYNDGVTPRIAIFSSDGSSHSSLSYSAPYGAALTGQHVLTDITPGAYDVVRDGTTVLTGRVVAADGSLSFTASGGTNYVIQASQQQASAPPTGLQASVE